MNAVPDLRFELLYWQAGLSRIAGIDEAGRGAWAGPVAAAVVILPADPGVLSRLPGVRDSKLMTPSARAFWEPHIKASALAWATGLASAREIDRIGILPATRLAVSRALSNLLPAAELLLTDYLILPQQELPQVGLVKGDRICLSIACASVLAKTARDAIMIRMASRYGDYGFDRNKGYGTARHRRALETCGRCPIHRTSFAIP